MDAQRVSQTMRCADIGPDDTTLMWSSYFDILFVFNAVGCVYYHIVRCGASKS